MEVALLALMAALVVVVVDVLRYLSAAQWRAAFTQLLAWAGGAIVVWLFAQSDVAGLLDFEGITLDALNIWSILIVGFSVGSGGSMLVKFKQAFDRSDSAKVPALGGGE